MSDRTPAECYRLGRLREVVAMVDQGMSVQQAARVFGFSLSEVREAMGKNSDARKTLWEMRQFRSHDDQTGRSVIGGY